MIGVEMGEREREIVRSGKVYKAECGTEGTFA